MMFSLRNRILAGYLVLVALLLAGSVLTLIAAIEDRTPEWVWIGTIVLTVAGLVVAGTLLVAMGSWFVRPLRELTAYAEEIQRGNLEVPPARHGDDEIGRLGAAFHAMAATLREFRRTDQARLLRTQASTRAAIDSLPHGVALFTPEGQVELANVLAERKFGLKPGAYASEIGHAWLMPLVEKVKATLQEVEPVGYEQVIQVFEEGQEKFFLPHGRPAMDESKNLVGITVVLVDATQLRQVDEAKSGLISMVSHELKTPLTSLQMSIHMLVEDAGLRLGTKQRELLLLAQEDANRLQRLIDELLDAGRMRAGPAAMQMEAVMPGDLVEGALAPLRGEFGAKGIEVVLELDGELDSVRVDVKGMTEVLANLLTNACKHTPRGGRVVVSTGMSEEFVEFFVRDSGVGVAVEDRERIFAGITGGAEGMNVEGAGWGLSRAREAVEAHGGTIGVTANHPHGALFHFTLPRAK